MIDWQNVYLTAREVFRLEGEPGRRGNFSPYRLGRLLAAAGDRGAGGELVSVEIHRGLPSQKFDRAGYIAVQRQADAWKAEDRKVVVPRLRPLRYRNYPAQRPTEKGVDVALAVSAIEAVLANRCDVVILFRRDADQLRPSRGVILTLLPPQTADFSRSAMIRHLENRE